jgi:AcrR family transcriptional regulator
VPLTERKQQRARDAIVRAAFELFAERGFQEVTVAEIAERAEVGRTTFFRYFGDKQEVLFADDETTLNRLLDDLRARTAMNPPAADSLAAWLEILRDCTLAQAGATADPSRTRILLQLLKDNPELQARHLLKQQRQATAISETLHGCGASQPVAALAPQLALACLHAAAEFGRRDWNMETAFNRLLDM